MYEEILPGFKPGGILGFDGTWAEPAPMMMETIVEAGYAGRSGSERFGFIDTYFNHAFMGDAFDEHNRLINRDQISSLSNQRILEFYDYFTQDAPRCMLRFAERANHPLKSHTQDPLVIGRRIRIEIALKVFFALHGHAAFCDRHIPKGFLQLEDAARRQRLATRRVA